MATTILRPCYATREDVRRAADVKLAAYNDAQIDRGIVASSESVDSLCNRKFYVFDTTRYFDWPNYQYAYPWRVWLDASELADVTVNVPVVVSGGVTIPNTSIFWGDPNYPTAPFTYLELDRSKNDAFGNGPTPQREIAITGTFGYWLVKNPAGTLGANMLIGDSTMQVSEGDSPGVGDVVFLDSERLIVTDATYIDTTITFAGASTASAADNVLAVPSGSAFTRGEEIMIDSEWFLIQAIFGNNLITKRAWNGSVIAAHTGATIWARRLLSVLRGQLGTVAAGHTSGAALNVQGVPGLIKQLAVAEAIEFITGETSAYAAYSGTGSVGSGVSLRSSTTMSSTTVREITPGIGIPVLRDRVLNSKYARKARSRVI